ncbi:type I restriction enzyme, S subunit [Epilithonimonas bovis DSM 19482]|uniref:Type I restriction enzyme, S subunit n=1 Tax=Epilithonimonas bovis DSM 19482 TaxID=1121284 RepID=A0A1U7PZV9_9FLAO|nr:restriction endonuclease subunit S [Epilithonimonas bovis]SIT97428.1 type I restriction enzyme, S subunit [Epilithonimonas bovis DSM 19482]
MTEIQKDNKNIANVPHLRFPGFTDEWELTSVDENCLLKGRIGYRGYTTGDLVEEGKGAFVLGGKHIKNQTIDLSEPTFLSWDKYYESPEIMVKVGDIIFSQRGTLGDCAIIEKEIGFATINPSMVLLKDITCNPKFLYYILIGENIQNEVQKNKALGAIPMLSQKQIKNFPFLIPKNPNEQQKISSFLSLIDEKIQTQIKIIEELKLLKNTLSKKIFSRQLTFKDDNGNDFPEWQHKKLGELATITTGSSNREDSILDGEYTFFDRSQDVRTSKRYLFNKEAVIVPGEGQKFTPKYFMGKFDLHQRTYAIFDFIELSGKYLYYHIDIDEKYLQSQAVGSTVKSLRLPMFQSMPIKFPPLEEQMKIANFLSSIDTKIDIETELLEKLEEQKKYLLQNLFI